MHHAGTQELETERLLLRRLLPGDAPAMYRNWASDPAATRYLRWPPHRNVRETAALLSAWADLYQNPDYYQWAIVEKASGELIGSISLMYELSVEPQVRDAWPGMDLADGIWEPGYCIGQRWWGRGYATEALRAVVEYWFGTVGGGWLSCCHAVMNPASGHVMRNVGFRYDHNAEYHKFDGTPVACRCYLLTRERYREKFPQKKKNNRGELF